MPGPARPSRSSPTSCVSSSRASERDVTVRSPIHRRHSSPGGQDNLPVVPLANSSSILSFPSRRFPHISRTREDRRHVRRRLHGHRAPCRFRSCPGDAPLLTTSTTRTGSSFAPLHRRIASSSSPSATEIRRPDSPPPTLLRTQRAFMSSAVSSFPNPFLARARSRAAACSSRRRAPRRRGRFPLAQASTPLCSGLHLGTA